MTSQGGGGKDKGIGKCVLIPAEQFAQRQLWRTSYPAGDSVMSPKQNSPATNTITAVATTSTDKKLRRLNFNRLKIKETEF